MFLFDISTLQVIKTSRYKTGSLCFVLTLKYEVNVRPFEIKKKLYLLSYKQKPKTSKSVYTKINTKLVCYQTTNVFLLNHQII